MGGWVGGSVGGWWEGEDSREKTGWYDINAHIHECGRHEGMDPDRAEGERGGGA